MIFNTTPPVDLGPDTDLLGELLTVWQKRLTTNIKRSLYHDGEQALVDFGISLPPEMSNVVAALGWIGKGVRALTNRSQFEAFSTTNGADDPLGVDAIMFDNQFRTEFPAACVSSAMHGCSFITVSDGDIASGEPDVLMLARDAETSAAIWDRRRRSLKGFLSLTEISEDGEPRAMVFYTWEWIYELWHTSSGWKYTQRRNPLGEVPAYPLVHGYELRRPLGHSRITKASMYFADAALRTIVRSEVSAELYAAPEYWLFGSNVRSFIGKNRWTALMGRIKALDVDHVGGEENPDLHRFTGASPQPHTDQLRMFATQFADEMDLDVRYADSANPSSADAIFAAKETLITGTKDVNNLWGFGAARAMNAAIRLRDGLTENTEEMRTLRAQFTDPMLVSPSGRADAFSKLATNIDGFASTDVGLRYAGLTQDQIIQLKAELQRAGAGDRIAQLVEATRAARADGPAPSGSDQVAATNPAEASLQEAQVLKAKADALGVLRRAGVDADSAAKLVGLTDVKFIPGQPITIKSPAEE
ncbi:MULTISPECIES: phage portal protein [unclassified Leucobacter]|uniref:phage portal protein n=1 Tax=unclassified Leucobacter TaxID=2621730 RepID=UPI0006222F64|nr:phage portal protein [Leucobacter sp. Ag1]KKI20554.1 hypothetical protein XM48_07480 [Leucobacter sp. Ag1]